MMRRPVAVAVTGVLAALSLAGARAADYPAREIELVVSFPAGGPADTAARIMAPKLSVPVVVANKPGGLLGDELPPTSSPHLQKNLSYKLSDFAPLGAYASDLGVITTRAGGPARTLEEFVEYARKNPGKLNYGSAGFGTVSFFTMELFKLAYGLDLVHVPFQGTGPVKNAVMGGHVTVATSGFGSLSPLIRSGDLIALVTTAPKRVADFASVPTMAEKGHPDASLNIWIGLLVPVKTGRARPSARAGGEGSLARLRDRKGRDARGLQGPRRHAEGARHRDRGGRQGVERLGLQKQ